MDAVQGTIGSAFSIYFPPPPTPSTRIRDEPQARNLVAAPDRPAPSPTSQIRDLEVGWQWGPHPHTQTISAEVATLSPVSPLNNTTIIGMDNPATEILRKVRSIKDLTPQLFTELRSSGLGRFAVTNFGVTPLEFFEWDEGIKEWGVEYDAQAERLIVKATTGKLHEDICKEFLVWFVDVSRAIEKEPEGRKFTPSLRHTTDLTGPFRNSSKEPDAGLREESEDTPVIAVEVGVSETRGKLLDDARRWLEGTEGTTRIVILVDIRETLLDSTSREREDNKDRPYELDPEALAAFDTLQLRDHMLKWHEERNESLLGELTAHIYICRRYQRPRKVLRFKFRLDGPSVTAYSSDQAFILKSELVSDHVSLLQQRDAKEFSCDDTYDSEDEDSYASQKVTINADDKIPLPLDVLKAGMEKCLVSHQRDRAGNRAKAILKRFGLFQRGAGEKRDVISV